MGFCLKYLGKETDLRSCLPMKLLIALSIGNQAAKVKTTMLVSMSGFMISSLQKNTEY